MDAENKSIPFKAETQQLLNILINSLYSDRDVFLRELISNASDALTKVNFEMLTNHNVVDQDAASEIRITLNKEEGTLTISDNGIGMNADELSENLGTIAHSGARSFLDAAKDKTDSNVNDLIGQFGVGFYAAFMAAESITVTSRSYRPEDSAACWRSDGNGTFTIEPALKTSRGTEVLIKLKEDAKEYDDDVKIKAIIKKHSNYIPYPIFVGDETEQINAGTVIWRQSASELNDEDYKNFYQSYMMDFADPLKRLHLSIDAPIQMYALLFIPASPEKNMFQLRKEDGLQLYARKVLIQDYCTDLLPRYYRFVQGVIDSEDIPLNVSRETMQANRIILSLKKILTGKVTDLLKTWGTQDAEKYGHFWEKFGEYLCEGVITEPDAKESLLPLLRFKTMNHGQEWRSLSDYVLEMKAEQKKIYYVIGDNLETLRNSPHTEKLRKDGIDALLLTKSYDPILIMYIDKFQDFEVINAATEKPEDKKDGEDEKKDESKPEVDQAIAVDLVSFVKEALKDFVSDVKTTDRLVNSPARLVDGEGAIPQEMQKIYRAMQQDYTAPKKTLEINPEHPLIQALSTCKDDELRKEIAEQIYDNAVIMDGETPNQIAMLERIQKLMIKLMDKSA